MKRQFFLYFFSLFIIACSGGSDESPISQQTTPIDNPQIQLPSKPTLTNTNTTPDSVSLSWSELFNTEYVVIYKNSELQREITDINIRSIDIGEMKSATSYTFRIDACNSQGCTQSEPLIVSTPQWPALNLTVKSTTQNTITLIWDAIPSLSYTVINTSGLSDSVIIDGLTVTEFVVTSLSIDTAYQFQVKACKNGACVIDGEISTRTETVIPEAPSSINLVRNDFDSVSFNWNASNYATFYKVKRDGVELTNSLTATTYTDNLVAAEAIYAYEIVACNQLGCSDASALDVTTPRQPFSVNIDAVSVSTISISWQAVSNAAYYGLYLVDNNTNTTSLIANINGQKYTVTDLASDTVYTFQITSCDTNTCVQEKEITAKTAVFSTIIPEPVTNLESQKTDKRVVLTWSPSEHADFYHIYRDSVLLANGEIIQSSFDDEELEANKTYDYEIEACNSDGCSVKQSISVTTLAKSVPTIIPAQPTPPRVNVSGSKKILVSWQLSSEADSYKLFRDGVEISQLTENSYQDTSLAVNTSYQYRVKACNALGCSPQSGTASATTTTKDSFTINLSGFDPQAGDFVPLNIYIEESLNVIFLDNRASRSENGSFTYSSKILSNGRYGVSIRGSATNGQTCVSNKPSVGRRTGGQDVEADVSCKTQVSFSFPFPTVQRFFRANARFKSQPVIAEKPDGTRITATALRYSSSDESVASIDEDSGIITQHKIGVTQITIRPKLDFYDGISASYELLLVSSESPVVLQKIEFGHSILLQTQNQFQVLPFKGKTIVRAFFYAESADNTSLPKVSLELSSSNGKLEKEMTCPTNARVGAFTSESYNNDDACIVTISEAEAEKYILPNMKATVKTDDGQAQAEFPKVSNNSYLRIVIVPIEVNGQSFSVPSEQSIMDAIKRVYPLHKVDIRIREKYVYQGSYNGFPVATDRWGPFLNEIESLRRAESDGKTHYYGMMPSRCFGVVGLAFVKGFSGIGVGSNCGSSSIDSTFIHELGHNLSLGHTSCGTTAGDSFWNSDTGWVGAASGELSSQPLFDLKNERVFAPGERGINNTDVMGYCNGLWLSEYHVDKVNSYIAGKPAYQASLSANPQIKSPSNNALIITAVIANNKVSMNPAVLTTSNDFSLNHGEYKMVIITKNGQQIEHRFSPLQYDHDSKHQYISEVIPVISNIERIMFYHNETLLDFELTPKAQLLAGTTKTYSHSQPITLTVGTTETIINWNNNDYPWMTLTFISSENEKRVVVLNKTGGTYKTDYFVDKPSGEIIVSISDGFNSLQLKKSF